MVSLKDREMCLPVMCNYCKYCFRVKVETYDGLGWEHYCMLDASAEDIAFVKQEVGNSRWGFVSRFVPEFSKRYQEIMHVEKWNYVSEGDRYVEADDCCNYFEDAGYEEKLNEEC